MTQTQGTQGKGQQHNQSGSQAEEKTSDFNQGLPSDGQSIEIEPLIYDIGLNLFNEKFLFKSFQIPNLVLVLVLQVNFPVIITVIQLMIQIMKVLILMKISLNR